MAKETRKPFKPDPAGSKFASPGAIDRAGAPRKATTATAKSMPAITEPMIRERAYQIYLKRNGGPGNAGADWAQAERELRAEMRR